VAVRLTELAPVGEAAASELRATIHAAGPDVHVRLFDETGALIAERGLPAEGTCRERADVLAVLLASWQAQVRSGAPPDLKLSAPPPPPVRRAPPWDIGIGVMVSLPGKATPGATLQVTVPVPFMSAAVPGFALHTSAGGSAARTVPIASGRAVWRRLAVTAGPSYTLPVSGFEITGSVDLAVSWFRAEGSSFMVNKRAGSVGLGAAALLRFTRSRPSDAWAPWIAVGSVVSGSRQRLVVKDSPGAVALPRVDFHGILGLSYRIGRALVSP
jgi:hypothetical protein